MITKFNQNTARLWLVKAGVLAVLVSVLSSLVVAGLVGCKAGAQRNLGTGVSGPFGIAAKPNSKSVYVLNSSFAGEFRDGSLLRFEANDQGVLEKKEALSIPRLGTELVVSPDGKWLVASFAGSEGGLRFYDISGETPVAKGGLAVAISGSVLGQLQFFAPAGAQPGEYYLWVVINPRLSGAQTLVLKWNGQTAKTLFRLPDDLPNGRPEEYNIGYGSPAFLKDENLLVALPQGGGGLTPDLPTPANYFKGTWDKDKADMRLVSAVMVDFDKYIPNPNLGLASAFATLAYNRDALQAAFKPVDPATPTQRIYDDTAESNKTLTYQNGFWPSVGVNEGGCYDRFPDTNMPKDSLLTVDIKNGSELNDYRAEIIRIDGWKKAKESMNLLPALEGLEHKKRLVPDLLNSSVYSRTQGVFQISEVQSYIQRIFIADTGTACQPLWARLEVDLNSPGSEIVRIQTNQGKPAGEPVSAVVPDHGAFAMTVRGNSIYTAEYAFGGIFAYKFENNVLTPLK